MTLEVLLAIALVGAMVGLAIRLERRMSRHRREAQAARRTLEVRVAERIADLGPPGEPGPGLAPAARVAGPQPAIPRMGPPADPGVRIARRLLEAPAGWSDEAWLDLWRVVAAVLLVVSIGLLAFPVLASLLGPLLVVASA